MEHAQEIEAQAQIWKHIYSFADTFTLRCAVELGIPDIIHSHEHPITVSQLASRLPVIANIDRLYRLLRYLVHMGILSREKDMISKEERFGLTPLSEILVREAENNVIPMVLVDFKVLMVPWFHMPWSLDTNASNTAFERVYGTKFWEYVGREVDFGGRLNEAMACETRSTMPTIIRDFKDVFGEISSLVDVGGGTGTAARAIADAFPQVKCTIFDYPHVVEASPECPGVGRVSGDMFDFIPQADALLLKWILHNYGDEDCLMILKRCKEALPEKGGKVFIVDTVMDDDDQNNNGAPNGHDEFRSARLALDIEMMLLFAGKERTEEEWRKLLGCAGFSRCTITRINSSIHSLIEASP